MYGRVLLPTDGSDAGDRAVEQAVGLARETDAALHALFVVEDHLREIGEAAIETIRARADEAGVEVVAALREGVPHATILEYADEADADVIVMGTHGRSGQDLPARQRH